MIGDGAEFVDWSLFRGSRYAPGQHNASSYYVEGKVGVRSYLPKEGGCWREVSICGGICLEPGNLERFDGEGRR